jgi:serine/threonine protein phosphatase 1
MGLRWRSFGPPPGVAAPQATVPAGTVVYAVGDVHGRSDLLGRLHRGIAHDAARRKAARRVLVYLGDYFSRGLDSRAVVERVLDWRPPGWEVVALRGNHEDLILRFLDGELRTGLHWLDYGGVEALAHYGIPMADPAARDEATAAALRERLLGALPAAHMDFLLGLVASHREGGYFFAHGGVLPGVPLEAQRERDLVWIRKRFLLSGADHGAVVVHGHCISPEPEVRPNRIGIDTGAYESGVLTCLVLDGEERSFLQTV